MKVVNKQYSLTRVLQFYFLFFVCGTALAFAFAFGIASLSEIAKGERLNLRLVDWSSRHQENKFCVYKNLSKIFNR